MVHSVDIQNKYKEQKAKYGSDLIVDILKQYDIDYVSCNPGATFRGLHDSVVNYNGNKSPELILCCHEEIAIAIAHGYAKASSKFMAVFVHSNVGLQHASMAIFNAWCDRVPMLIIGGIGPLDSTKRRPWIDWIHTSNYQAEIIRDYVKWDDQPYNLASVPESLYRACRITSTDPKAPVYIAVDALIQEEKITKGIILDDISRYSPPVSPQADYEVLEKLSNLLLNAKQPVVIVDYMGRHVESVKSLINLVELLSIPVIDCGGRYNFPNNHPLCLTGANKKFLKNVDVILALDVSDLYGSLGESNRADRSYKNHLTRKTKVVHITMKDCLISKWSADYQKLYPVNLAITADTSLAIPALYELCQKRISDKEREQIQVRFKKIQKMHCQLRSMWKRTALIKQAETPLSVPTVLYEIWQVIKKENWALSNSASVAIGKWIKKIWEFDREGSYFGETGGAGLGYGIGASIGIALANKNSGKICINLQADGDFLFTPSALWTAVHHSIPLLTIMMNNRSYGNTKGHALEIAKIRERNKSRAHIGIDINNPIVDFPTMAKSFGAISFPTIEKLKEIGPTIAKAIRIIKKERKPVLVDIIMQ